MQRKNLICLPMQHQMTQIAVQENQMRTEAFGSIKQSWQERIYR
jgi:hypothetical protein